MTYPSPNVRYVEYEQNLVLKLDSESAEYLDEKGTETWESKTCVTAFNGNLDAKLTDMKLEARSTKMDFSHHQVANSSSSLPNQSSNPGLMSSWKTKN